MPIEPSPETPEMISARQAFRAAYVAAVDLSVDRGATEELESEASPALEALSRWVALDEDDPDALVRSEALAMVSLLGRRAARLDISPTAALALVEGLVAGIEASKRARTQVACALRAVCLEGYVAASAERVEEKRGAAWVEEQPIVEFVEHGLLLLPSGLCDEARITELGERFARKLFRREARVGWVDLSALSGPTSARAGALLGIYEGTAMLGCACVFSSVHEAWHAAFEEAAEDPSRLILEPTFHGGLTAALREVDHEVRPRGPLAAALKRLRGR